MKPGEIRGAERERLWRRVMIAWRVRPQEYWYPLAEGAGLDLLAFEAPYFEEALLAGRQLHAILAGRAIEHVFELLEGGCAYRMELADLHPVYGGAEGFWCSEAMDWILYASHEGSVTVGGSWLVYAVKAAWPAWERHTWTAAAFP